MRSASAIVGSGRAPSGSRRAPPGRSNQPSRCGAGDRIRKAARIAGPARRRWRPPRPGTVPSCDLVTPRSAPQSVPQSCFVADPKHDARATTSADDHENAPLAGQSTKSSCAATVRAHRRFEAGVARERDEVLAGRCPVVHRRSAARSDGTRIGASATWRTPSDPVERCSERARAWHAWRQASLDARIRTNQPGARGAARNPDSGLVERCFR